MSVIMTLRVKGDAPKLESIAAEQPDRLPAIAEKAKARGVIAHRFYASDDGELLAVDEWPDVDGFEAFFDECRSEIQAVMDDIGVSSEPEIRFWRKLDTNDEIGWSD